MVQPKLPKIPDNSSGGWGKRYDNIGEPQDTTHYEYTLPNGEEQEVTIERLAVKGSVGGIIVVRRGD